MKKWLLAGLLICTTSVWADSTRTEQLNSLLSKGRYDALIAQLAPEKFARGKTLDQSTLDEDLSWLKLKSEAGETPLMFVYAYRLLQRGASSAEVMKWYGTGRTRTFLAAKSCRSSNVYPWSMMLDGNFFELQQLRLKKGLEYLQGVDVALKAFKANAIPSGSWFCGENNLLSENEIESATWARWEELNANNQRKLLAGKDD